MPGGMDRPSRLGWCTPRRWVTPWVGWTARPRTGTVPCSSALGLPTRYAAGVFPELLEIMRPGQRRAATTSASSCWMGWPNPAEPTTSTPRFLARAYEEVSDDSS